MKNHLLAAIAAVLTFAAFAHLVPVLIFFSAWGDLGAFGVYGPRFLVLAILAAVTWYAAGLGRKDDWPRS